MVNLEKTRADIERHKAEIVDRLKQIPAEIKKLNDEAEQAKRQLIGIEQILDGFSLMENENFPPFESFGLTDSVRQILSETKVHLVPTQIRDALLQKGITGSSSKVLLINVHKTLERIDGELEKSTTPEGKTAYRRNEPWSRYIGVFNPIEPIPGIANPFGRLKTLSDLNPTQGAGSAPALPIHRRRAPRYRRASLKKFGIPSSDDIPGKDE